MKEIVKPALVLFIITAVAAALLGVVSETTKSAIAEQTAKTQAVAMQEVLPEAEEFKLDETAELTGTIQSVNIGYKGGEICGYVLNVQPAGGFGGKIDIMVGISADSVMTGLKVLSHSETPGLGAKSTDPEFYGQYSQKSEFPLTVVKTGASGANEIQAITSATITSVAVTDGANEAYAWYSANIGGAK